MWRGRGGGELDMGTQIKKNINALCCKFQVLSQDLLLRIFNICGESDDVTTLRSLPLVCKGFRSITILNAEWAAPLLIRLHGPFKAVEKALLDNAPPIPYIELSLRLERNLLKVVNDMTHASEALIRKCARK